MLSVCSQLLWTRQHLLFLVQKLQQLCTSNMTLHCKGWPPIDAANPTSQINLVCNAQAMTAVLTAGVALSLTLGAPSAATAAPIRLEDKRIEREAALQEQMRKLEYAFEQQQTAKKAEIVGK